MRAGLSQRLLQHPRVLGGQDLRTAGAGGAEPLAPRPGATQIWLRPWHDQHPQRAGDQVHHRPSVPYRRHPHLPLARRRTGMPDPRPPAVGRGREGLSQPRHGRRHPCGDRLSQPAGGTRRPVSAHHRRRPWLAGRARDGRPAGGATDPAGAGRPRPVPAGPGARQQRQRHLPGTHHRQPAVPGRGGLLPPAGGTALPPAPGKRHGPGRLPHSA